MNDGRMAARDDNWVYRKTRSGGVKSTKVRRGATLTRLLRVGGTKGRDEGRRGEVGEEEEGAGMESDTGDVAFSGNNEGRGVNCWRVFARW